MAEVDPPCTTGCLLFGGDPKYGQSVGTRQIWIESNDRLEGFTV